LLSKVVGFGCKASSRRKSMETCRETCSVRQFSAFSGIFRLNFLLWKSSWI